MEFKYNVTGNDKKKLIKAVSDILGCEAKYLGAPSFAYEIGGVTVDKNGSLIFDDTTDSAEAEMLVEALLEKDFTPEGTEGSVISIELPRESLSETGLQNLRKIIAGKAELIKKALGASDLTVIATEDRLCFPWFNQELDSFNIGIYGSFICRLIEMAKTQKRVNTTDYAVENERYAFRCFLLRLGFIGDEYKAARKVLLSRLKGSSAYAKKKGDGDNG